MSTGMALHHVLLAMPHGEEASARAFFGGLLGLVEVAKPAALAGRGGCWFRGGAVELHLGVEEPFVPARKAHPALAVDDLDAVLARLAAAGIEVTPDTAFPGFRRAYVDDPFGNRLELLTAVGEDRSLAEALERVAGALERHGLRYQAIGGLAARAYGATRPLADADLCLDFAEGEAALAELAPLAVLPPGRVQTNMWDVTAAVYEVADRQVECTDIGNRPRFRAVNDEWHAFDVDLDHPLWLPVLGRRTPVMPRAQLAAYKRLLDRNVDRLDLLALDAVPGDGEDPQGGGTATR